MNNLQLTPITPTPVLNAEKHETHYQTPSEFAYRKAMNFSDRILISNRKKMGQVFTPPEIAEFMASLPNLQRPIRTILDPGAGTGILSCALLEKLTDGPVHLDVYEEDSQLSCICQEVLSYAQQWLAMRGIKMSFEVHQKDFAKTCSSASNIQRKYDLAISNPPYFKLQANDPRLKQQSEITKGQPNIYSFFMSIMASLLNEDGEMVTITPRSFSSGSYFQKFRKNFFTAITPASIHVFNSRKHAFKHDAILQENVILHGKKGAVESVAISTSEGKNDLDARQTRQVPLLSVLNKHDGYILRIPQNEIDDQIVEFVNQWAFTLLSHDLNVSTGPVVAFRAWDFMHEEARGAKHTVPLLWLHHVKEMSVVWPLKDSDKPQYISRSPASKNLLVTNKNYVLMRRFSAKEELKKLVAAPYLGNLASDFIGIENHLNYIYRPNGDLSANEVFGLSALLGSSLLDRYFRISNGNTQVNAEEIRSLPLPSLEVITEIGKEIRTYRKNGARLNLNEILIRDLDIPEGLLQ